MKRIISVALIMIMLLVMAVPALAASGYVSLGASATSLKRGDSFTVTASLSGAEPIALGTVVLNFDSSVFTLTGGSCHVAGANPGLVVAAQKAGTFMLSGDPQAISGTLFTFNFVVNSDAAFGNYTISSSASVGVDVGEGIGSGSVNIDVVCDHSYGDWTKADDTNHSKTCATCQDVQTEGHSWDGGKETKPATCKEDGVLTYTCSVCKGTKTEPVAKNENHTFGNLTSVNDTSHKDTCSVCNKEITQDHTWNGGEETKKATCKDDGEILYTCTGCGHTKTEIVPKSDEHHKFGNLTAVDDTNHKDTCSVCKKEISQGHTWNGGAVTKRETCKEDGEKTYTCTGCTHKKTEVIPVTDVHTWTAWTKTDANSHKRTCSVCEKEETGNHNYRTAWKSNETEHWHECAECKDKKDVEKHIPGPEATEKDPQVCTTCDYKINPALEHKHNYADTWTTDETGHWYKCDGCEEKGSEAAHDFENACDPDCSVCGYTRETAHSFGDAWETDDVNHWHVCAGCGEKADEAAHEPGPEATAKTPQTCTICAYEIAPALGEEVDPGDGDTFPWWIVLVAVVVIGGGAVAFVVMKKKKG